MDPFSNGQEEVGEHDPGREVRRSRFLIKKTNIRLTIIFRGFSVFPGLLSFDRFLRKN